MVKNIRIIRQRDVSFGRSLEQRANELTEGLEAQRWDDSAVAVMQREIALALDHIHSLRELREQQRHSLLRVECYIYTELIQMEQRTPRYSPYRFPEREKLQRRLQQLEQERRKLAADQQERLQALRDRLLSLLNRHAQLTFENGDRETSR